MKEVFGRSYRHWLWFGSTACYVAVFFLSLRLPLTGNQLNWIFILPLTHFGLTERLSVALSQATVSTALSWILGWAHQLPYWQQAGVVQTVLFYSVVVACYLFRKNYAAEVHRLSSEVATSHEQASSLQVKVDRLNSEVNKSIFDILAVYEFTTALGGTLNLNEMYDMMVDTIMRVARYDGCLLALVDEATESLQVKAARGLTFEQLERFGQVRVGQGLLGHVLKTAQPLIVPSLADQTWSGEFQQLPYKSMLALPLVVHGRSIGAFCLFRDEANAFGQDDLRVLFIVANQCAFAVQNGRLYQETARLAITDGLTGLYNHRYFRSCIEEAVGRAEKNGNPVSMIMIDADGFKGINDKYGHQRGDQVLEGMARVITSCVRESDFVARYGGEEFAVILPDTGSREAYQVAARIHQSVAATDFSGLRVTVSLGVATYPSGGVSSKDDLISMADELAYRAKEGGRNRICSADL